MTLVFKAYAAEQVAVLFGESDTQLCKRGARVRHEALAACFVDGRRTGLHNRAADIPLAQRDGGGQASRTTTDDQDVCFGRRAHAR
jgi:hypothetical protein